jgi:purine-binding chemotaxis protein CheW
MSEQPLQQVLQKQSSQQSQLNKPLNAVESDIVQLIGFYIGDEEYAIPIINIQEIIKPIEYTRVPSVPEYVLGVFNMRGNVMPLIDLASLFNLGHCEMGPHTRYIVLRRENESGIVGDAGFVIDKLTEAIKMPRSKIDPPPQTLNSRNGMILGIGKRDDGILTILKAEALLKRNF